MKINTIIWPKQSQNETANINQLDKSLASGKKINSAADNAAALQIIDRLTSQQDGYGQAVSNAYDGISYSQVTESNLSGVNDAVSRIRELSIQAGNGALNDSDRSALQEEVVQLQSQITETFENASFGGKPLFDGQAVSFQVGPDANTTQNLTPSNGSVAGVIAGIDISTQAGAQAAIDISGQASEEINAQRAELGAFQNTLESTIRGLGTQQENIAASQSRIQDTDYAQAISQQVSNDILAQASIALRGQANQSAESILGLL
jgi:flagellin